MKKITLQDKIWLGAFLLGFALILYKCRFGFANIDEAFYLTIPYRLIQGDALFQEEWNLSQMSSLLLYPLLWLYLKMTQSTEGILLAFRYLYTLIHSGTAIFIYIWLRKDNRGAGFASILYLLFTPFGIMALSYNSMGIGLMVITGILLYKNEANRKGPFFGAGITFAGAVLCCPYLLLWYFLFGVICFLRKIYAKQHPSWEYVLLLRGFGWFTWGGVLTAVVFLIFVFSRCKIEQLWDVIFIILDDPEHTTKSLSYAFRSLLTELFYSNSISKYIFPCVFLLSIVTIVDKNRKAHEGTYLIAVALFTVIYMIPFLTTHIYINYLMVPLAILGAFLFLLDSEKYTREMFFLWIPGVLYAFSINWSSNQGFYVIADAMLLSTIGSVLMIATYCWGLSNKKKRAWYQYSCIGLLTAYVLCTATIRCNSLFAEIGGMSNMTYEFTQGCQKGIIASPTQGNRYDDLYQTTATVRNHPSEKVLYFTVNTWLYLEDTKENASYSSWLPVNEHSERKLLAYYDKNPSKIPDIIYSEKEDWEDAQHIPRFFTQRGYQVLEEDSAYIIIRPDLPGV